MDQGLQERHGSDVFLLWLPGARSLVRAPGVLCVRCPWLLGARSARCALCVPCVWCMGLLGDCFFVFQYFFETGGKRLRAHNKKRHELRAAVQRASL